MSTTTMIKRAKDQYVLQEDELSGMECEDCGAYFENNGEEFSECPDCNGYILNYTCHEGEKCAICQNEFEMWGEAYAKMRGDELLCENCYDNLPETIVIEKFALIWIGKFVLPKLIIEGGIPEGLEIEDVIDKYKGAIYQKCDTLRIEVNSENLIQVNEKLIQFLNLKSPNGKLDAALADILTEEINDDILESPISDKVAFSKKTFEEFILENRIK